MSLGYDIKVETKEDFNQIAKEIEKELQKQLYGGAVAAVSDAVAKELRDVLGFHIRHDVYDAYEPKGLIHYERRSEHRGLGTSLLESADEDHAQSIFKLESNGSWTTGIRYEPTAEHEHYEWSEPDLELDRLISRIEKKEPPYNYEPRTGKIPKRPFWQEFVTEMIEGGRFAKTVEEILKEKGIAEPGDSITGVIRDESDGNY